MALRSPVPELQIGFCRRLADLRELFLLDALLSTVGKCDIAIVDDELEKSAPKAGLAKLASWGLRGELVFPVPSILRQNPRLLGYYRLLLGLSQKEFYGQSYGFGPFKGMEERGQINAKCDTELEHLCDTLSHSGGLLVDGVDKLDKVSLHELTLLTLGPQLRGGILNTLGSDATKKVFAVIREHIAKALVEETESTLKIKNAAGRIVHVAFSADPDIVIAEELASGSQRNQVAIEIKGGKDVSNIHNRIGEAEKSHQKARERGFVECWTLVGVSELDLELAGRESPSTDRFFRIGEIVKSGSKEHLEFREELLSRIGLKD